MQQIHESLTEYATLTGFIHEPDPELGEKRTYPAILVLPGGGFRFCSSREGEPIAASYFAKGYQAFVLDYTTVSKKADAVIDDPMKVVESALNWLKAHEDTLHITAHRTAMIGFSGGGHLAAAVSTHGPVRPDALILIYPGILPNPLRALDCPDIIESVDQNTPASFLIGSRQDFVTPPAHQLSFAEALEHADVDFELHIFQGGGHGLSLATELTAGDNPSAIDPVFASWFDLSLRWLDGQWKNIRPDGSRQKYSAELPLERLMKHQHIALILKEKIPGIDQLAEHPVAKQIPLAGLVGFAPDVVSKEQVEEVNLLLQTL